MSTVAIIRLTHGLDAMDWAPAAPTTRAIMTPIPVKVITMDAPYTNDILMALARSCPCFVKYETVRGIMGKTQGVRSEANPAPMARKIKGQNPLLRKES